MFRTGNKFIQIVSPSGKRPISGTVAAAAVAGLFMAYESDTVPENERKLVPATGKRGALLEVEVVAQATFDANILAQQAFQNDLRTKLPVGAAVSARYAEWIEVEGSDRLHAGITTATAVDTPLTTAAGKLKVWASSADGEIVGYLRRHLTKKVTASACRIEVELLQ